MAVYKLEVTHKDFILPAYQKDDKQIQQDAEIILRKLETKYPGLTFKFKIGQKEGQLERHEITLRVWVDGADIKQIWL